MKIQTTLILLLLVLFMFGCAEKQSVNAVNTQTNDEVPAVVKVQTVEDIKAAKAAGQPTSEFQRCMEEAKLAYEKYESFRNECEKSKLAIAGYTDGINCIQNHDLPVCKDIKRYNAEVDASNACRKEELPTELKNRITVTDCMALMPK